MRKLIFLATLSATLFACGDDNMSYRTIQSKNQVERQGTVAGVRVVEQTIPLRTQRAGDTISMWPMTIFAFNPSTRLSMAVEVFFEPESMSEDEIDTFNSSNWSLRARAIGARRASNLLHEIPDEQGTDLPRAYEVVSGVKLLQASLDLGTPTSAAVAIDGTWYARAYWEAVTEVSDAELIKLFNDCSIVVASS